MIIKIRPLDDWEYFYRLILGHEDNTRTREEVEFVVDNMGHLFFEVYGNGELRGVAFTTLLGGEYSLHAYNERITKDTIMGAIEVGRRMIDLMLGYFTDVLYTSHFKKHTHITKLAKKAGFRFHSEIGPIITLQAGG